MTQIFLAIKDHKSDPLAATKRVYCRNQPIHKTFDHTTNQIRSLSRFTMMKSSLNVATVVATLSCSILLCFVVTPCIGFQQQPLRPLPCNFAGCRSKSLHSSLASIPNHFSRFGGRPTTSVSRQQNDKLVWWRSNSNQQTPSSPLMADVSASAGDEKKSILDKVCIRLDLIASVLVYQTCIKRSTRVLIWNMRAQPNFDN